jgi:hypothetical protein
MVDPPRNAFLRTWNDLARLLQLVHEIVTTARMAESLNSHDISLIILMSIFSVLTGTVIGLRLWSRKTYMKGWQLDDWLMIAAYVNITFQTIADFSVD